MDYRFYKLGDDFCKRAKGVEQAKEVLTDVVNLMQRDILEGKKTYRPEYYIASLSLWEVNTVEAMLYLEVLRHSQEELAYEAGVQGASSTADVKRLNKKALDAFSGLSQLCEELKANKNKVQAVLEDYQNGVNDVTVDILRNAYFNSAEKHFEIRERVAEYIQEQVLPASDMCEQYATDLRHLNEEEDLRRFRGDADTDDEECGLE